MRNKKSALILILVTLVGFGLGFFIATYHTSSKLAYTTKGDTSAKGTSQKVTSTDAPTKSTTTGNTTTSDPTSVPANNDPYPVTTEHYQIEQIDAKQFKITLYAIINSPSQHDEYISQLKQYKKEVLAYLTNRYGDLSTFILDWNPPSAKDL